MDTRVVHLITTQLFLEYFLVSHFQQTSCKQKREKVHICQGGARLKIGKATLNVTQIEVQAHLNLLTCTCGPENYSEFLAHSLPGLRACVVSRFSSRFLET